MESANKKLSMQNSIMETEELAKLKDEEKWQYLVRDLNLLSDRVLELQAENSELKASMAMQMVKSLSLKIRLKKQRRKSEI